MNRVLTFVERGDHLSCDTVQLIINQINNTNMNKCLFSHNWEMWRDITKDKIVKTNPINDYKHTVGEYLTQERRCLRCGKKQITRTQTPLLE